MRSSQNVSSVAEDCKLSCPSKVLACRQLPDLARPARVAASILASRQFKMFHCFWNNLDVHPQVPYICLRAMLSYQESTVPTVPERWSNRSLCLNRYKKGTKPPFRAHSLPDLVQKTNDWHVQIPSTKSQDQVLNRVIKIDTDMDCTVSHSLTDNWPNSG